MKAKKILAALLSAAMVITSAAVPVLADGGNTLTVGKGKTYDNVQTALDNANEGDTIAIDAGEYDAFKVEKNNITLTAADKNNKPVINTLYDGAATSTKGVEITGSNATFENLVFHTGESTGSSSLGTPNSGDHGSLTVKGCVFYGNATTAYAVWMNHGNMTIEDCYFNNYGNKQSTGGAIQPYTLNDMEKLTVKNSEIVDCFPYAINVQAGKGEIEIADSVFLNSNIQVANNPPDSTGICNISNSSFNGTMAMIQRTTTVTGSDIIGGQQFLGRNGAPMTFDGCYISNTIAIGSRTNPATEPNISFVAKIGDIPFRTFDMALAAAQDGDTITMLDGVVVDSGSTSKDTGTVTINKNITITSENSDNKAEFKNTKFILNAPTKFTNLKFTGNSTIDTSSAKEFGLEGCDVDVTLADGDKIRYTPTFIGTKGWEDHPTKLNIKNNTINVADNYPAVLSWCQVDTSEISGNVFGSADKPYSFDKSSTGDFAIVKVLNVADGATITLSNNTLYGSVERGNCYGFDLYQNNSRQCAALVVSKDNKFNIVDKSDSDEFVGSAFYIEMNKMNDPKAQGYTVVDSNSTYNESALSLKNFGEDGNAVNYGVDVTYDENGKVTGGTFGKDVTDDFVKKYVADGLIGVENPDGTFTVKQGYTVTLNTNAVGGTASVDPKLAAEGQIVTVTANPDPGYGFDVIVADAEGTPVHVNENNTFVMPASDVTVMVSFRELMADDTLGHTVMEDTEVIVDKESQFPEGMTAEQFAQNLEVDLSPREIRDIYADVNNDQDILTKAEAKFEGAENIYIHAIPELDVKVESYDDNVFKLDISPVCHIYASTSPVMTEDAVPLKDFDITVDRKVNLVIPVPADLANAANLKITHTHGEEPDVQYAAANEDGNVEFSVYGLSNIVIEAAVDGDGTIEFATSAGNPVRVEGMENTYSLTVDSSVTSINVRPSYIGDDITEVKIGDKVVGNGIESESINLPFGTTAIAIEVTKGGTKITYTINVTRETVSDIALYFKETGSPRLYDIVLKAEDSNVINRLNSADLTFALEPADAVSYQILPKDKSNIDIIDAGDDRYEFHFGTKTGVTNDSDNEITIGQVAFTGNGTITFKVDDSEGVTTNAAHATSADDNIVTDFYPEGNAVPGAGTLKVNGDTIMDSGIKYHGTISDTLSSVKKDLAINIMFPNEIKDAAEDYTNMTVSLNSALDALEPVNEGKPFSLGGTGEGQTLITNDDGYVQYTVTADIIADTRYTATFKGEGYRTYSVDVVVPADAETASITVWNNVMDNPKAVVAVDGVEQPDNNEQFTFLAGDIDNSQHIDLYDLSAAVAYFGKAGMKNDDGTLAAENGTYVQYDLNRDGTIDSKDIAMVLVSWGN